jgi:hypothetical protein
VVFDSVLERVLDLGQCSAAALLDVYLIFITFYYFLLFPIIISIITIIFICLPVDPPLSTRQERVHLNVTLAAFQARPIAAVVRRSQTRLGKMYGNEILYCTEYAGLYSTL